MVRGTVVPTIIVVAIVIALISTSYPSVVISNVSTKSSPGFVTYTSQYEVEYPQATASTVVGGYSSATAWYPGNPVCDPASNACTPYATPTATFVYPLTMTYAYMTTITSQATSTYTSEFTLFSTQTGRQNIPAYAAAGLSGFQYGILAIAVVAVLVLSLLFMFAKGEAVFSRPARMETSKSARPVRFCQHCGLANPDAGKFCTRCGARLE